MESRARPLRGRIGLDQVGQNNGARLGARYCEFRHSALSEAARYQVLFARFLVAFATGEFRALSPPRAGDKGEGNRKWIYLRLTSTQLPRALRQASARREARSESQSGLRQRRINGLIHVAFRKEINKQRCVFLACLRRIHSLNKLH